MHKDVLCSLEQETQGTFKEKSPEKSTQSTEGVVWSLFITGQYRPVRYTMWRRPYIRGTYTGIVDWACVLCRQRCYHEIGLFGVTLDLCFKMSPRSKPFLWKWLWFAWKRTCRQNSFSYQWFARRLVSTQRKEATREWPIWCQMIKKKICIIKICPR